MSDENEKLSFNLDFLDSKNKSKSSDASKEISPKATGRTCPKCAKAYDDSWSMCLNCNVNLVGERAGENTPAHEKSTGQNGDDGSKKSGANQAVTIISYAVGFFIMKFFGFYTLLVPGLGVLACWWTGKKLAKPTAQPFVNAFAVQGGHAIWMLVGLMYLGSLTHSLIWDILILVVGLIWLFVRPGITPVIILTGYQILGLSYGIYQLFVPGEVLVQGVNIYKALPIHLVLRVAALIYLYRGFSSLPRELKVPSKKALIFFSVIGILVVGLVGLGLWGTHEEKQQRNSISRIPFLSEQVSEAGFKVILPSEKWRFLKGDLAEKVMGEPVDDKAICISNGHVHALFIGQEVEEPKSMADIVASFKQDFFKDYEITNEELKDHTSLIEGSKISYGEKESLSVSTKILNKMVIVAFLKGGSDQYALAKPEIQEIIISDGTDSINLLDKEVSKKV